MEVKHFMGNLLLTAGEGSMGSFITLGLMMVAVYMLILMPQRKQQKRDAKMRASIDIGDEIVTTGGIVGRIVSIKEDTIMVETGSDRVKIRFVKSAIAQNVTALETAAANKAALAESKKKN